MIGNLKTRIRRELIDRRKEKDSAWRAEASERVVDCALALPEVREAGNVSVFVSFGAEIDTHPLISSLIETKGSVLVPRIVPGSPILALHRAKTFPEGFAPGIREILEPQVQIYPETAAIDDVDVIFVPGVAFSREGHRIGYGGGYYDRLLDRAATVLKIGLGFSFQLLDALSADDRDVPLDALVTEEAFVRFGEVR